MVLEAISSEQHHLIFWTHFWFHAPNLIDNLLSINWQPNKVIFQFVKTKNKKQTDEVISYLVIGIFYLFIFKKA